MVEKITRTRKGEALTILEAELAEAQWYAASAFTVEKHPRVEAQNLAWWHQNTPANERSETARNLAYLRAYLKIARSDRLPAQGIQIEGARLWMDRSVIGRLERDGYLAFEQEPKGAFEPMFELTESGRIWVTK